MLLYRLHRRFVAVWPRKRQTASAQMTMNSRLQLRFAVLTTQKKPIHCFVLSCCSSSKITFWLTNFSLKFVSCDAVVSAPWPLLVVGFYFLTECISDRGVLYCRCSHFPYMDHPVDFVKKLICPMTITSSGPICPCPCLTVSSLARPASPLSGLWRYTTNLANYNLGGIT